MTRIFHWLFMWKMDPLSVFDMSVLCLHYPPVTVHCSAKRCVHLWNNFPCIKSLVPPVQMQGIDLYSLNFKYSNKMCLKFDSLILPLLNLNIPQPRFKSLKGIVNIFQNISNSSLFLDYEFTYFSSTPRCVRNDKKMYNLCAIYMSVSIDGRWKPILCEIARRICVLITPT